MRFFTGFISNMIDFLLMDSTKCGDKSGIVPDPRSLLYILRLSVSLFVDGFFVTPARDGR